MIFLIRVIPDNFSGHFSDDLPDDQVKTAHYKFVNNKAVIDWVKQDVRDRHTAGVHQAKYFLVNTGNLEVEEINVKIVPAQIYVDLN